jgi:hypothetical protein
MYRDHAKGAIDAKTKRLDLELKELDIELKKLELANKPGFWKGVFTNPAFLAAIITVFIAGGTAAVTFIVAADQRRQEQDRYDHTVMKEMISAKCRRKAVVR